MKYARSLMQAALFSLFAVAMVGTATLEPVTPPDAEEQCAPGCSQPACDISCGGPGTGVCERCRCYCTM